MKIDNYAAARAMFVDYDPVRTRGVVKLIFEVPEANFNAAFAALGGHPMSGETRWCGIARLDPEMMKQDPTLEPAPSADAKPEKERRPFLSLPRSQQAALACDSPQFRHWLRADGKEDAAQWVRTACGVKSRSELDHDQRAAAAWDRSYTRYLTETGQIAEARG